MSATAKKPKKQDTGGTVTRRRIGKPIRATLLDQLIAVGIAPLTTDSTAILEVDPDGNGGWLTVDDATYVLALPVIAAHNAVAIDALAAKVVTDRVAARALVVQVAQSAVNVRFDQLNAAQVRALVAIVLWQAGALDGSGVVQPLAGWVR